MARYLLRKNCSSYSSTSSCPVLGFVLSFHILTRSAERDAKGNPEGAGWTRCEPRGITLAEDCSLQCYRLAADTSFLGSFFFSAVIWTDISRKSSSSIFFQFETSHFAWKEIKFLAVLGLSSNPYANLWIHNHVCLPTKSTMNAVSVLPIWTPAFVSCGVVLLDLDGEGMKIFNTSQFPFEKLNKFVVLYRCQRWEWSAPKWME